MRRELLSGLVGGDPRPGWLLFYRLLCCGLLCCGLLFYRLLFYRLLCCGLALGSALGSALGLRSSPLSPFWRTRCGLSLGVVRRLKNRQDLPYLLMQLVYPAMRVRRIQRLHAAGNRAYIAVLGRVRPQLLRQFLNLGTGQIVVGKGAIRL